MKVDVLSREQQTELKRILNLKDIKQIERMGKLFTTEFNNYFYDTGTGKVILIDDEIYNIMYVLFNNKISADKSENIFKSDSISGTLSEFLTVVLSEHLLNSPSMDKLYTYNHYENLENSINHDLHQIILELTGRCNLRCGYCIYNDDYQFNRSFNQNDMSIEIAKASVDYAEKHSDKDIAVTFYGGEPLLKFDLLKSTINYALERLTNKNLSFSLTTNLTLVTKEIADFFASVPNLSIVCSLDGPEYVQNSYRKYINSTGTFNDAIIGLELLSNAFSRSSTNTLSINAVLAPPYKYDKINDINSFFKDLKFLPHNTNINIGYAADNSVKEKGHILALRNNPKYTHNSDNKLNPLWIWQKKQAEIHQQIRDGKNSIYASAIEEALVHIHKRYISDEIIDKFPFNGCCVPGARRLYVDANGNLSTCERIGTSPSIGNIICGINFENIRKFYIDDYSAGSIKYCANCWAIRLCSTCYVDNYCETGFCAEEKNSKCEGMRNSLVSQLSLFHSLQESSPEKLRFLEDMVVV
ncbi:MAG: radical SAM protein [Oscillospiraceae bacterium]